MIRFHPCLSPVSLFGCSLHPPMQHRSAPGTPLNSSHRIHRHLRQQQRAPSAEEGAGSAFLHVPFSRMRGKSLPEDMENTLDRDSLYLLKQFNIQGRKVLIVFPSEGRGNVNWECSGDPSWRFVPAQKHQQPSILSFTRVCPYSYNMALFLSYTSKP